MIRHGAGDAVPATMTLGPQASYGAALLTLGLVLSTTIAARTVRHAIQVRYGDQTISATGSARHRIRSDLIVWRAHIRSRATTQREAYAALASEVPRVRSFLEHHGVASSELAVSSVASVELHARDNAGVELPEQVIGYALTQTLSVSSHHVEEVSAVSRSVTEMLDEGIDVQSDPPEYLYTRLAELKIELLAAAARDARTRASQIATQTGARLATLASARMGVIQVNAANQTDVSAEGINDTTSLDKDAFAVVTTVFYTD